jgi:hypothetical protein
MKRGIDLLLGITLLAASGIPNTALAVDWFEGSYCLKGECWVHKQCEKATVSPAQIYENNKGRGAKIVDKADGRVEVIVADPDKLVWGFFRDAESCQRYADEQVRAAERQRREEQERLNKYR